MKRLILLAAMALTCALTAVANVVLTRIIDFNPFTFTAWFIVPVGAIGVGVLGTSGLAIATRLFNIKPKPIDYVPVLMIAPRQWY